MTTEYLAYFVGICGVVTLVSLLIACFNVGQCIRELDKLDKAQREYRKWRNDNGH